MQCKCLKKAKFATLPFIHSPPPLIFISEYPMTKAEKKKEKKICGKGECEWLNPSRFAAQSFVHHICIRKFNSHPLSSFESNELDHERSRIAHKEGLASSLVFPPLRKIPPPHPLNKTKAIKA